MPANNRFAHQNYPTQPVIAPRLITLRCVAPVADLAAELHTRVRIGRVIVVHGTFVGNDPFAVAETLKSLGSGVPLIGEQLEKMAEMIQENTQPATNSVIQDMGTYTEAFCKQFQQLSLRAFYQGVKMVGLTWQFHQKRDRIHSKKDIDTYRGSNLGKSYIAEI